MTEARRRATGLRAWAVLWLGLGLWVGWVVPTLAGGLILDARPAGDAGPQLDAASISPLPVARTAAPTRPATYTVQPGDTVSGIAARLDVDMAALAARNGLADLDRLAVGQVLQVRTAPVGASILPPDAPLVRVQFWPWPPAQGQTLAIWLQAREPASLGVQFAGQAYPVVGAGSRGWTLIPLAALAQPGMRPLTITVGAQVLRLAVPLVAGSFPTGSIPASAAAPILSQPAKVQAERLQLAKIFGHVTAGDWTARSRFVLPLDGDFPHTSPFGSRRVYGDNPTPSAHEGEDFSAGPGTPVYAPAAGTVALAEPLFVRGNAIVLDHGHGVYSGYWHLSELAVGVGARVLTGQRLGAVGSTGLSTGAHLHWELRVAGQAVDPLQWVAQ